MDKFVEMMHLIKNSKERFGQVIAVDRQFALFKRAWCVAEIAEGTASHIPASLKVASAKSINDNYESTIEKLDLRECEASHEED